MRKKLCKSVMSVVLSAAMLFPNCGVLWNNSVQAGTARIPDGDVTFDGKINFDDFEKIDQFIRGYNVTEYGMDVNWDAYINMEDVYCMFRIVHDHLLVTPTDYVDMDYNDYTGVLVYFGNKVGDMNKDHYVNGKDLELLKTACKSNKPSNIQVVLGDYDKDGSLSMSDFTALAKQVLFINFDGCNLNDSADLKAFNDYISGQVEITEVQENNADLNGDDTVNAEDFNMMLYGYYLNLNDNPNLTAYEFYITTMPTLGYELGDLNNDKLIGDIDYELLGSIVNGSSEPTYLQQVLGDMDKDGNIDNEDLNLYESMYCADTPFTYTSDIQAKTITITGMKDNNTELLYIKPTYTINGCDYTVTTIGNNAFSNCSRLAAVYIPSTVTTIQAKKTSLSPFYGCDPDILDIYCEVSDDQPGWDRYWDGNSYNRCIYSYTMKNIGDWFYYTADTQNKTIEITGLKNYSNTDIYIDDWYLLNGEVYNVTSIGYDAFYDDDFIVDMYLPSTLISIGDEAFSDMDDIYEIDLKRCQKLTTIGSRAFANPGDPTDFYPGVLPASVTTIKADTPYDSPFWGFPTDIPLLCKFKTIPSGFGAYWNYVSDTETIPFSLGE